MCYMYHVLKRCLGRKDQFKNTYSIWWWRASHTHSRNKFEGGKKKIEQNHKTILGAMGGFTKWGFHMGIWTKFVESKFEIDLGQEILGGEDCNVPI